MGMGHLCGWVWTVGGGGQGPLYGKVCTWGKALCGWATLPHTFPYRTDAGGNECTHWKYSLDMLRVEDFNCQKVKELEMRELSTISFRGNEVILRWTTNSSKFVFELFGALHTWPQSWSYCLWTSWCHINMLWTSPIVQFFPFLILYQCNTCFI